MKTKLKQEITDIIANAKVHHEIKNGKIEFHIPKEIVDEIITLTSKTIDYVIKDLEKEKAHAENPRDVGTVQFGWDACLETIRARKKELFK